MEEKVRITEEKKVGFKEETKVDMKIYQAPVSVAKWFKRWCDIQGMRMSEGMVLIKQIVISYEERSSLETHISQNREMIEQLFELLDEIKNPVKQPTIRKPGFGANKRNGGEE